MDLIVNMMDFFLHLDEHLSVVIVNFGYWTYVLLFIIIFAETGFVVTPFLPGDSLLFIVGAFAAQGSLNIIVIFVTLCLAAILGDSLNYAIGKKLGPKVFKYENARFLKKEYLDYTHKFYEKYGAKTIVLARFVPIVRTFAPFVAGVGQMNYAKFISYNVIGGIIWVVVFVFAGFWFGNISFVKNNFELVIWAIVFLSILPIVIKVLKVRREKKVKIKPIPISKLKEEVNK